MVFNDVLIETLYKIARENKNSYFVYCDAMGNTIFDKFIGIEKERIVPCGISEANAMGIAAGLALSGKKVYLCYTSIFWSTRALEQLRVDIAYNNVDVTIIALQAGINSCNPKGGYSHWAIEDINNTRTLPNLKILNPASISQLERALHEKGPVYIRIENHLSDFNPVALDSEKKITKLVDGTDLVLISCGDFTQYALNLAKKLNDMNIYPAVYNCYSLKPFDYEVFDKILKSKIPVVTIENHGIGGLGTIVSEYIAIKNCNCKFFPLRIDNDSTKFNIVGDLDYVIEKLFNLKSKTSKIIEIVDKKNCYLPIKKKYSIDEKFKITCSFLVFNFPLFTLVEREQIKKNKFKYKLYIGDKKYRIL